MARSINESDLAAIVAIIHASPNGAGIQQIEDSIPEAISRRTLQYRLRMLVRDKRVVMRGSGRWARYCFPATSTLEETPSDTVMALSTGSLEILSYLRGTPEVRRPVGYDRGFLDAYRPNTTHYLSEDDRRGLFEVGSPRMGDQPAGTFARQILDRLLIDLSWNSSRLEGNTYTLLDTRRLIAFSQEARGRDRAEAQMILNHKEAIEFLVDSVDDVGFNRYSLTNLHALLANNLLPDPAAPGRLRRIIVGIQGSPYRPLETPQLIEECFDELIGKAEAIRDPFEQAFFTMVHLPYLQPFDDVNKRLSRIAANIPLIKSNLCPLSYTDVEKDTYTQAVLGVYEMNRVDLMRDVFLFAYRKSAARLAAIRQTIGYPDPFRLEYRDHICELVSEVVRGQLGRKDAVSHVERGVSERAKADERERLRDVVESELISLHEGNFARYKLRPAEFAAWQAVWNETEGQKQGDGH